MVVRVAADVAHGDARVLGLVADDLDELLAPLLGQRRHRNADDVAGGRRIQAEVGVADRLFDHRDHLLLPRLHRDRSRVGERDVRALADRHRRAVVVDLDVIEEARVRAAGADLAEVVLQRLDRLLHLLLGGFLDVGDIIVTSHPNEAATACGVERPRILEHLAMHERSLVLAQHHALQRAGNRRSKTP